MAAPPTIFGEPESIFMPITIACTNPDCKQACTVPDDHAGRIVRCPKCPAVIQVPLHPQLVAHPAQAENFELDLNQFDFAPDTPAPLSRNITPPPMTMPPPPPGDVLTQLTTFFRECRLGNASRIVLACALGCYVLVLLSIMLPWQTVQGLEFTRTRIGLLTISGAASFFLTLAVVAFLVTVVLLRRPLLFEIALWSCAGWAALSSLWRVIDIITFHGNFGGMRGSAGFGLYLALAASLGAAGTSGFVAFSRLSRRPEQNRVE